MLERQHMAGQHLLTVGSTRQLDQLCKGIFLGGHREPRITMVGRSNVGKSSLINALLGGRLAQVSNQPGKTRKIHFYLWKELGKIISDLPGYGYARSSKAERDEWGDLIHSYLRADQGLERALLLLDARHGPLDLDKEAIRFLSLESVPVTFIMTKSDALKTQSERSRRRKEVAQALQELGYDPESVFWVSSRTSDGIKELIRELATPAPPIQSK